MEETQRDSAATAENNETESSNQSVISETEAEVERILNSPNPLTEIKKHLDNLIAGEDYNKQLVFLLLLSGKVPDPKKKQMLLLKGEAGAGKTTVINIADLFKTKTIGRLSETALDYTEDLQSFEVLKLQELGHMDYDRPLKFVSADDRGYTIEVTVPSRQDESTGGSTAPFRTYTKHIPAITLITSTTRLSTDQQFKRRSWIITLDESEEQTEKVRTYKVAIETEEDRLNQGLINETSYSRSKKILTALVNKIKPCKVIIPFRNHLTQLLPRHRVEVRGHFDKILNLVYLHGVLLQRQLPKLNDSVVITTERAYEALEISQQAFEAMSSMESRVAKLIQALISAGFVKNNVIDREARADIGRKIGKTPRTILTYFNFLEDEGYVSSISRGREKLFELLVDPEEISKRFASLKSKLEHKKDLMLLMTLEARTYLTELCNQKGIGEREREELLKYFPISK